jgi:biotin transport system substrate-specific component
VPSILKPLEASLSALNPSISSPRVIADLIPGDRARDAGLVLGGAALTGLAAQVSVLIPAVSPVPFTLQTAAALLVGASLGMVRGLLSMVVYLLAGLAGVPWFAAGEAGWGHSGGYLLGFVAAAALVGWLSERGEDRRYLSSVGEMVLGNLVIYAFGVTVLVLSHPEINTLADGLTYGAVPFLMWDLLKIAVVAGVLPLAWKLVGRNAD